MAEIERSTVEILKAARERITPEERWTRGAFARTADGHLLIHPESPLATCWCASGAVIHEAMARGLAGRPAMEALEEAADGRIFNLNDGRRAVTTEDRHPRRAPKTHAAVLAAFDRAIKAAEQSTPKPKKDQGER